MYTHDRVATLDVENTPKIPKDGSANAHECEQSNHLAAESAGEGKPGSQEPEPPSGCELSVFWSAKAPGKVRQLPVALLMKLDISKKS